MKNLNILFLAFVFVFASCEESTVEEQDAAFFGYEYFPVEVGYLWEYEVDSVLILQGGFSKIISSSYIREEITNLISENGGERRFRLDRS